MTAVPILRDGRGAAYEHFKEPPFIYWDDSDSAFPGWSLVYEDRHGSVQDEVLLGEDERDAQREASLVLRLVAS